MPTPPAMVAGLVAHLVQLKRCCINQAGEQGGDGVFTAALPLSYRDLHPGRDSNPRPTVYAKYPLPTPPAMVAAIQKRLPIPKKLRRGKVDESFGTSVSRRPVPRGYASAPQNDLFRQGFRPCCFV